MNEKLTDEVRRAISLPLNASIKDTSASALTVPDEWFDLVVPEMSHEEASLVVTRDYIKWLRSFPRVEMPEENNEEH